MQNMHNMLRLQNFDTWLAVLPQATETKMIEIQHEVAQMEDAGTIIYPPTPDRYKALELVAPSEVKVVILGQDPYHGDHQAMGLSFSVGKTVTPPPSLKNIFKELVSDIHCPMPTTGDLTPWAREGVLLLNTCLTVEAHKPASHKDLGWQEVTREIIKQTLLLPQPLVYICWGRFAEKVIKEAKQTLDAVGKTVSNKTYIASTHPSPYSANKPAAGLASFMGSKPFSRTNATLLHQGAQPVRWELP